MSEAIDRFLTALRNRGHEPRKAGNGWSCRCPAHEDRNPSLSIRAGDDGRALVTCHAGCTVDAVCSAIGLRSADLFANDPSRRNGCASQTRPSVTETKSNTSNQMGIGDGDCKTFRTDGDAVRELERKRGPRSAIWTYQDAAGDPVGVVLRWDPSTGKEIRPVSRLADGSGWCISGMPSPRPLYCLPELLKTNPGDRVYVTEGEKAADAARAIGLVATTSPHGSKSAGKADWSRVAGRDAVILPDHDEPGEGYADDVARLAAAAGAKSVRVVRLVELWDGMPKGGDMADLLAHHTESGRSKETLREKIEALVVNTAEAAPTNIDETARSCAMLPQAERIVSMVQRNYRLGQNEKREAFAVGFSGRNVAMFLSGAGGAIRDEIAFEYRKQFQGVMSSTAFADALATLRGEAMRNPHESVHLRVGRNGPDIVLDLGTVEGSAVLIRPHRWDVVDRSPILFERSALVGALPRPVRGGSLDTLRQLLNVTDETWPILLGWIVASLIPDMPHPILMFGGQQGSGKTTAARFICGIFDPSDVPIRSQPRDPEQWAMSIANSWTTIIDNISTIPDWWSDALCKAVTGDGWIRRTLYTNNDVSVMSFKRVVALTSIDAGALRGDLGERLALVDLDPIEPGRRRTESALNREYLTARPAILGALLDLVAEVLARIDNVRMENAPRMADFAHVLAAIDASLGSKSLALYLDQDKRIACDVVDADPIGSALAEWMTSREMEWSGTAGQLMEAIKPANSDRAWPRNAKAFSARLRRLIPAFALQGFTITPPKAGSHKRVFFVVQTTAQTAQQPIYASGGMKTKNHDGAVETGTAQQPDDSPSERMPFSHTNEDSGRSGCLGCSTQALSDAGEWGET